MIGFSDKLRFMVMTLDDMRPCREFSIRGCRESRFSNDGHLFAAVNGNTIQVYSSVSFENMHNLKGHNGTVRGNTDAPTLHCQSRDSSVSTVTGHSPARVGTFLCHPALALGSTDSQPKSAKRLSCGIRQAKYEVGRKSAFKNIFMDHIIVFRREEQTYFLKIILICDVKICIVPFFQF